jgi:deazaflavin-dependent oxidoreductase (nitroreductase family)
MSQRQQTPARRLQHRARYYSRRFLHPLALRVAGRPGSPYGVVRHEGRETGRVYETPVLVGATSGRFVIPLSGGVEADWYRDVRAAGECTVAWQGRAYRADSPRLVSPAVARAAFPLGTHRLAQATGAEEFLRLERGEEVPGEYRAIVERHPGGGAAAAGLAFGLAAWWLWSRRD